MEIFGFVSPDFWWRVIAGFGLLFSSALKVCDLIPWVLQVEILRVGLEQAIACV